MNYDKIALKALFNNQDLTLLNRIKPEYMSKAVPRFLVKALKQYVKKFGKIPDISVFTAELATSMANSDNVDKYKGYLDGLVLETGAIDSDTLVNALLGQYIINQADLRVEELVSSLADRDVDRVKELIATLHGTLNTSEKTPKDMRDISYVPTKIRSVKPFITSMFDQGVKMGGLTIIGAGTGAGKSVLLINQLMFSYEKEKISTCLLNLELGSDESLARMYSHATGTPFKDVYGNDDYTERVTTWKDTYFNQEGCTFTMENVRFNNEEIIAVIRQQAAMGVTLFGIDYLQLVDAEGHLKEWEALRDLIRDLHTLTLELGIVIISPVQINLEEVEEDSGEVKIKVRGSRELENSATLFLFLYQTKEEYTQGVARLFTIKARNAEKCTYLLNADFAHMTFTDTEIVLK